MDEDHNTPNLKVLDPAVKQFITTNLKANLHQLMLKKSPFAGLQMREIAEQIKGRIAAHKKFPFLLEEDILFPPNLNLEQASSQATAEYKAALVAGKNMADLTCGFGIDAFYLSQKFDETTLVEHNRTLIKIVEHNWRILNRRARFVNSDLEGFLDLITEKFDCIYLDPARRDHNRNKVFLLEDLSPNLIEIQDKLLAVSRRILIKLSPLIDITYLASTLQNICEIHIVAVKNDVKEILVLICPEQPAKTIAVTCTNLESADGDFSFRFGDEAGASAEFSEARQYLYIPNNAVLKSGAFNLLAQKFSLKKLHPNTHLYTSYTAVHSFPGRVFPVEKISPKNLRKGESYNIIAKNYPLKPEEIKKKYKLNDGGTAYLIFTEDAAGKAVLRSK